jgi:hypothetical protein
MGDLNGRWDELHISAPAKSKLRQTSPNKPMSILPRTARFAGTNNDGKFIERWRSLGIGGKQEEFIDMNSITFGNYPGLWVKTTKTKGYELTSFEFDCTNRKLRPLTVMTYDDQGKVTSSSDGYQAFTPVIPDTIGEHLLNGACRTK